MDAQAFTDAMTAALGTLDLTKQFSASLQLIGVPQVPTFKLGSSKLESTELLAQHKMLLDLEFKRLSIVDADKKTDFLKTSLGRNFIDVVQDLKITAGGDKYDKTFKAIQKRYGLENPEPQARQKFLYEIDHRPGDDPISMSERLRKTGRLCNYADDNELNKMILQILLAKSMDRKWRMHVRSNKLDLEAALEYASQLRQDRDADKAVENTNNSNKVKFVNRSFRPGRPRQKSGFQFRNRSSSKNRFRSSSAPSCRFCGRSHGPNKEDCPSWGTFCTKCNGPNHWAQFCREKKIKKKKFFQKKRYNQDRIKNVNVKEEEKGKETRSSEEEDPDSFVRHVKLSSLN